MFFLFFPLPPSLYSIGPNPGLLVLRNLPYLTANYSGFIKKRTSNDFNFVFPWLINHGYISEKQSINGRRTFFALNGQIYYQWHEKHQLTQFYLNQPMYYFSYLSAKQLWKLSIVDFTTVTSIPCCLKHCRFVLSGFILSLQQIILVGAWFSFFLLKVKTKNRTYVTFE